MMYIYESVSHMYANVLFLGIVSNPKRSAFEVGAPHMKGSYIQTDAALNQGNSGGNFEIPS